MSTNGNGAAQDAKAGSPLSGSPSKIPRHTYLRRTPYSGTRGHSTASAYAPSSSPAAAAKTAAAQPRVATTVPSPSPLVSGLPRAIGVDLVFPLLVPSAGETANTARAVDDLDAVPPMRRSFVVAAAGTTGDFQRTLSEKSVDRLTNLPKLNIHKMDAIGAEVVEEIELEELEAHPSRESSTQQSTLEYGPLSPEAVRRLTTELTRQKSSMTKPQSISFENNLNPGPDAPFVLPKKNDSETSHFQFQYPILPQMIPSGGTTKDRDRATAYADEHFGENMYGTIHFQKSDLLAWYIKLPHADSKPDSDNGLGHQTFRRGLRRNLHDHVKFRGGQAHTRHGSFKTFNKSLRQVGTRRVDHMINFLHNHLKYALPRLLISVAGGAADFVMPKELEKILKDGLRKAAESTDAWIVTGGTNCGVMRYVGQAMAEIVDGQYADEATGARKAGIPVIGISAYGVLGARQALQTGGAHYDVYSDTKVEHPELGNHGDPNTGIDHNHNVFFFVDNGEVGTKQFGTELELRAQFEQRLTEVSVPMDSKKLGGGAGRSLLTCDRVFSVVLLVEGGWFSLQIVVEAVLKHTPVVVVQGSGRCADTIAYAWKYLHDKTPSGKEYTRAGLRSQIRKMQMTAMSVEKVREAERRVLSIVIMEHRIHVYDYIADQLDDGKVEGVQTAILKSLMAGRRPTVTDVVLPPDVKEDNLTESLRTYAEYNMLQTKLYLALVFNREDLASHFLLEMRRISRVCGMTDLRDRLQNDTHQALLWSLEQHRFKLAAEISPMVDLHAFLHDRGQDNLKKLFALKASTALSKSSTKEVSLEYLDQLYESTFTKEQSHKLLRESMSDAIVRDSMAKGESAKAAMAKAIGTLKGAVTHKRTAGIEHLMANRLVVRKMASMVPGRKMSSIATRLMMVGFDLTNPEHQSIKRDWQEEAVAEGRRQRFSSGSIDFGEGADHDDNMDNEGNIGVTQKHLHARACQDLLIWGCLTSDMKMAMFFWERGSNSVSNALFISVLLKRIASAQTLHRHTKYRDNVEKLREMSAKFEETAIGVLDQCWSDNSDLAQKILRQRMDHLHLHAVDDAFQDCIQLAMVGRSLLFGAHPAYTAVIEAGWYGEIDSNTSDLAIFLNSICPLLLLQTKVLAVTFNNKIPYEDDYEGGVEVTTFLDEETRSPDRPHRRMGFSIRQNSVPQSFEDMSFDLNYDQSVASGTSRGKPKRIPLTWITKMGRLYTAPRTKLYLDMISQASLLMLMMVLVIYEFGEKRSVIEYTLYCWFGVLTVDKLWNAVVTGPIKWVNAHWHYFELFQDTTFWLSVFFRNFGVHKKGNQAERPSQDPLTMFTAHAVARFIAGVTVVCLTVRLTRFFYAAENLGPKVHMVSRIFADVKVFVSFLFIMALAAGQIFHVLLYPSGLPWESDNMARGGLFSEILHVAHRMFFRPAFMTFGELFIQDLHDEAACIGVEPFTSCSTASLSWVLPVMMIGYLMMAQIILVNLLIAMMSTTYALVEVEAYQVWNMSKADLLKEYKTKPALPQTPFSVFQLAYSMVHFLLTKGAEVATDAMGVVHPVEPGGANHLATGRANPASQSFGFSGFGQERQMGAILQESITLKTIEAFQEKNTERYLDKYKRMREPNFNVMAKLTEDHSYVRGVIHDLRTQLLYVERVACSTFEEIDNLKISFKSDLKKHSLGLGSPRHSQVETDVDHAETPDMHTALPPPQASSRLLKTVSIAQLQIKIEQTQFLDATGSHSRAYPSSPDRKFDHYGWKVAWRPTPHSFTLHDSDPSQPAFLYSIHSNAEEVEAKPVLDPLRPSSKTFDPAVIDNWVVEEDTTEDDDSSGAEEPERIQENEDDDSSGAEEPERIQENTTEDDDSSGAEEPERVPAKKHEMVGDDELFVMYEAELPAFIATVGRHGNKEKELPAHLFNGDEVLRCELTPEQTNWGTEYKEYDPVYYVSPYVLFFGPSCPISANYNVFKWAHPEVLQDAIDQDLLAPSYHGDYMVDGTPQNPVRRTGIIGRGVLGHWGPNLARYQVITRWRRDDSMARIDRKGRPLLEVLLCKKFSSDCWALPGALRRRGDLINPIVMRVLGIDDKEYNERNDVLKEVEETLIARSVVIYQGCTFDDRDTDNAWMESEVAHFHDDDDTLGAIRIRDHGEGMIQGAAWAVVHEDLTLTANHREILNTIAHRLRAYW